MSLPIPTEEIEQRQFVQWLEIKGYKFTAIPNHTRTPYIGVRVKNRLMGVRAGLPDVFVIANGHPLFVEMKRQKGGAASPDQKDWIEALNAAGIPAKVCKGCEEAIAFVQAVVGSRPPA